LDTLTTILEYFSRILPGLVLIGATFLLIKPRAHLRMAIYILAFALMRDAMTPLGLWRLGAERGVLWIRLSTDPLFLVFFGLGSSLIVAAMYAFDEENRKHLTWFRAGKVQGLLVGLAGCILVVAPLFVAYRRIDLGLRGGPVSPSLLPSILAFAMLGNLYEEALFRGYVLGYLEQRQPSPVAGLNSGVAFALCHVFLALTVTDVGVPVLAFALWEGAIAGLVGAKYGVVPATVTHGGAVFLLTSGLF
jgi:hypothetical protein